MRDNTVNITLLDGQDAAGGPLFQYDYGQRVLFAGAQLPAAFEVHFGNTERLGDSVSVIGSGGAADIPDACLESGRDVWFWIFLHTGEDDGETVFRGRIRVVARTKVTHEEPTPVQQSEISQAIAALNAGAAAAAQAQTEAEGAAAAAGNSADAAAGSAAAALGSAGDAEGSARRADGSAADADAAAGRAGASATAADASAGLAAGSADASAESATASAGSAAAAAGSASAAGRSAAAAAGSATEAAGSASAAGRSAAAAAGSATEAAGSARNAAIAAESVRNAAATAETLAPGSEATVTVADVSGTKVFQFGIPQGIQGPKGDPGEESVMVGTLISGNMYRLGLERV